MLLRFQPARDDSTLSPLADLQNWLRSLHTHASISSRGGDGGHDGTLSPPVFIVGTHRDSVHPDEAERRRIVRNKFQLRLTYMHIVHNLATCMRTSMVKMVTGSGKVQALKRMHS